MTRLRRLGRSGHSLWAILAVALAAYLLLATAFAGVA